MRLPACVRAVLSAFTCIGTMATEASRYTAPDPQHMVLSTGAMPEAGGEGVSRANALLSSVGELPASFTGDLPCADCAGIRYRLNLFRDRSFFLSSTYLGRETPHTDFDMGKLDTVQRQTCAGADGRP